AGRGNQVQIAANSRLGRVQITEVVSAVDDPKLFVASRGVEDFLICWQHDECREANLGVDGDNVAFAILNGAGTGLPRRCGVQAGRGENTKREGPDKSEAVKNLRFHLPVSF